MDWPEVSLSDAQGPTWVGSVGISCPLGRDTGIPHGRVLEAMSLSARGWSGADVHAHVTEA